MDIFFEQLVKIKKTGKTYLAYAGIALAAIIIMAASYLFLPQLFIIIAAATLYGAYKLYSMLSVEYEYIITNSTMDIDKITAKSSRKRILSFELTAVERVEKYRDGLPQDILSGCFFACNKNDSNAIVLVIHPEGKSKQSVTVAPDERMLDTMKKFLPKYVADTLN